MPVLFIVSFWKFFATGFAHWSFHDRYEGIITAWNMFCDHPFFGVGIGGYGPWLYQHSHGFKVVFHEPNAQMFEEPMNTITELLASLGSVGLIAFMWMFFIYFRYLNNVIKNLKSSLEETGKIYGLIISTAVMIVVLQFNQNLFRSYVWIHLAICLGYVFAVRLNHEKP